MLKLINTTSTSLTASTAIPLNLKYSTNSNLSFSNNTITINKPGYYRISGVFNITATTTGSSAIQIYANGTPITEAINTQTVASGDTYEYVIDDIERVIGNSTTNKVLLTIVPSVAGTLVNANVSISEVR